MIGNIYIVGGSDWRMTDVTTAQTPKIYTNLNVGIGQDNPQSKLQIENAGEQLRLTYPSVASYIHEVKSNGDYAIDKDGTERLRITSAGQLQATGAADVRLTLGSGGTAGTNDSVHVRADGANLLFMNASGGLTKFERNGTETLTLTSGGDVSIPNGNITMGSGRGINFHNYGSGSSVDSNILDDYEEGTWTPTPGSGTGQWAAISVSNPCRYIKIGKLCTCFAVFSRNDSSSVSGANLEIYGLPFTTANSGLLSVHGNYWADNGGVNTDTAGSNIYLAPNNTRLMFVRLHDKDESIHPDTRYFQTNDISHNRPIYTCFTYETA